MRTKRQQRNHRKWLKWKRNFIKEGTIMLPFIIGVLILGFVGYIATTLYTWFKGATITNAPNLYKETIMKIEYTTKKDLIRQIEDKGFKPLSMNATIQDMKIYLLALNVEATLKKVAKQVTK